MRIETLKTLSLIKSTKQDSDTLVDAVYVALDELKGNNEKLKFNRILLIITDGETELTGADEDAISVIQEQCTGEYYLIYIAMIGKVNKETSANKRYNAKLLFDLASSIPGGRGFYHEIESLGDFYKLIHSGKFNAPNEAN